MALQNTGTVQHTVSQPTDNLSLYCCENLKSHMLQGKLPVMQVVLKCRMPNPLKL